MLILYACLFAFALPQWVTAIGAPNPGVLFELIDFADREKAVNWFAVQRALYNDTKVSIRFHCPHDMDPERPFRFHAQFVLRSSPCFKEFQAVIAQIHENGADSAATVQLYFEQKAAKLKQLHYDQSLYYQSRSQMIKCGDAVDFEEQPIGRLEAVNLTALNDAESDGRRKKRRASQTKKNDPNYDITHLNPTLKSDHPAIVTSVDAVYLLILKACFKFFIPLFITEEDRRNSFNVTNVTVEISWRGPQGYLSANDYPLLTFYAVMCAVYAVLAFLWLVVSVLQWKDLLRIQFWIGAVILLGMIEKALFTAEYSQVNQYGYSMPGTIQMAELMSCLKRTLARMLIIIVSVGFGVVKPRLGATLHRVVAVAFFYFILSSIEGTVRVTKNDPNAETQKKMVEVPLILLDVAIFWWIFTSLTNTMRALRLRRNEAKLSLYRHFTNTLLFCLTASVVYMCWSLYTHAFELCLRDWKELWVDTAFWHVLFSVILMVIMVLWRPTNNNQRYAFTPLLDNGSDDDSDDEDTIFSGAFTTGEQLAMRGIVHTTKPENRKDRTNEAQMDLERELKWVEENIPSSIADKLVADSDEELEQTKFEVSKMQ